MLNWAILSISYTHFTSTVRVVTDTNNPVHLTMYYTHLAPDTHKDSRIIRGVGLPWGAYFCFVGWKSIEQNEAGDTLIHTFDVPVWSYCMTYWFCFIGTVGAVASPSISAIFKHHHNGVLTTTNRIVLNKAYYQCFRSGNPGDPDLLYLLAHDQAIADLYYELAIIYGQQVRTVGSYASAMIRRLAMIFTTTIIGGHELISATLRLDIRKTTAPSGYINDYDWYLKIRAGLDLNSQIVHGSLANYPKILSLGSQVASKYADDLPDPGYQDYWYIDIPISYINTTGYTVITSLTSKDESATRPLNNRTESALFIADSFTRLELVYLQQ